MTPPQWHGNVFGAPPPAFAFLSEIFANTTQRGEESKPHYSQRVSFVNNLDVKATIYHQMNADMVVTTGSSFPLVAVTISPKVRWSSDAI